MQMGTFRSNKPEAEIACGVEGSDAILPVFGIAGDRPGGAHTDPTRPKE